MSRHLLLSLFVFSVIASPLQAAEPLRVVGSTTVLPIVAEAAKQYRQLNPGLTLTVSGGGSGVGVSAVQQGTAEIGMLSRAVTAQEQQRLGAGFKVVAVARDAVAVAISKVVFEGGVTQLSIAQIAAIYRGEIKNWQEVGGPDARILVIDKEPSRGTRHVFAKVVLGDEQARAPGATIISGSNNEEQAAIAASNQAIGMLSNAWLNDAVRAVAVGEPGKAVLPTLEHVADGSYPIQRELTILLPRNAGKQVEGFVEFLLSDAGQRIVEQVGYLRAR
ncbi:MAG: substrate-binding domain-containing protein [Pseudomonadota bacterium]|nr:substrate-binding domain-containing protein [Pseudomonadota bacterium]